MDITLSKQTIMTIFNALEYSSNSLQAKISFEDNSTIKAIYECELAEIDEALEIIDEIIKENIY